MVPKIISRIRVNKPSDIEKAFLESNHAAWKGMIDDIDDPWPAIICEL